MIKKIVILLLITIVSLSAIEESAIKEVMHKKIDKATSILQSKSLSIKQKEYQTVALMDDIFDYSIMAKISLGKRWNKLTKEERNAFIKAFEKRLKQSYFNKLQLYTNEKVTITNLKKVKTNRIYLESNIIKKNEVYKIIYKFYKQKKRDNWLIYDVNLAGVSIILTYKKQFKEFFKEKKSFNQLLESLNKINI